MLNYLLALDTSTFLWCNRFQHRAGIIRFFRQVSRTGDGYLYALLAIILYLFEPDTGKLFVATGLLAYLFEIPAFIGLKNLIRRDRPFVRLENASRSIQSGDKFSLPSGHSAGAFLMAGLISYFYPVFAPLAYVWASAVGVSRVMLGVHYPTDILAGAVLGTMCTLAAMALVV